MLIDETRWKLSVLQPPEAIGGKVYTPIRKTPKRGPDAPKHASPRVGVWERKRRERAARRGTGWLPTAPAPNALSSVATMIYGLGRERP